ncbi:uncharacterized protein LOC111193427 isoform X3 [Astyanax mexicanus]|uniref:uncharacterized protein LOC111193427 isoform X1 n=1 Tax=Astyanax mexicanus TaxID=7994 RepID=UPI0020CAB104|nr:uncharacterized protein LOC111193427 isoform X1 [Astyanax mexicanus]XP_049335959.1 uncharacterized protein LOC111193427 isoform X2 [Astyanax mexicanus]XP_049335960.1 uncharacterized protein LOC111193427 isoform X3 [Astyanax mexicanus]
MDLQCFIIHILVMITISVSPTTVGHDDFRPADIYINSSSGTVKVGESITIKCAIFQHNHSNEEINMYLCKNGVGVEMGPIGQKGDYVFIKKNVSELDSGNYSCVYSSKKSPASNVSAPGQKTIHLQVSSEPAGSVQSNYTKFLLFSLGSLLLIGSLVLGTCCTRRSCNKPKNRGERNDRKDQLISCEKVQDNTGQFKGSVPVHQAGKRTENNDEMYAYATIPDITVDPVPSTSDAELPVYSLAQNSAIYSTARKPERLSYMETKQTAAIYGKVQKKGKG